MTARPFRRRNALALHNLHYGPNMTPMVDVVMVILVFFMASTVILGPEWFVRSAIPQRAQTSAPTPTEPPRILRMTLERAGPTTRATIDSQPIELDALEGLLGTRLATPGGPLSVLVTPQPDVPYADVVRVHEACHRLGIDRVGIFEATPPR